MQKLFDDYKSTEGDWYRTIDAEILMLNTIYEKYKKDIDKIYCKIDKTIKKKPYKRYYFVDPNKYKEKELLCLRIFFKDSFKISNTKPIDPDTHVTYRIAESPITINGNSFTTTTALTAATSADTVIVKPAGFYITW